jgi:hypothetical protein
MWRFGTRQGLQERPLGDILLLIAQDLATSPPFIVGFSKILGRHEEGLTAVEVRTAVTAGSLTSIICILNLRPFSLQPSDISYVRLIRRAQHASLMRPSTAAAK